MSLVERALQKLQQTSPRVAVPAGSAAEVQVAVQAPPARPVAPGPLGQPLAMNVVALRSAGLLPPQAEEHQLAQQYRRVKRPLIANAIGRGAPRVQGGQLIMVTSALPGEGKTFTSLNLALSMSIRPTDVPNLAILPAGTQSSEATELLASARMGQVTAALAEHDHQRIVVFDSPPLLHTTESHALAQSMGQVVVVVRAESTAQPVVLDALKLLEGHRAVSLVLNQSVKSASTAYYYRYGEGSDAAAER